MAGITTRNVIAGAVGNMLEWYDFAVFGFFSSAISTQIFPSDDPIDGLINTFGVFAIGYLARPLGGVLLGQLGDRVGRTRALQISIIAMAVPTALISVLPSHAAIGYWAAVLLVVLRLAQGFSVGGEFIGSICYLVEVAPPGKRALYGSYAVFSTVAGMLLGSAVAAILHLVMTNATINDWGWRLPFLGGVVLGAFGWNLRRRLVEAPEFQAILDREATLAHPVLQAMRRVPVQMVQVGVTVLLLAVGIYTLFIWMPTYLTTIITPPVESALLINTLAMALLIAVMPLAGMLADRYGYKRVLVLVMLATAIAAYPLFVWIDTRALVAIVVAQAIFAVANGFIQGPVPIAMASQFPIELRYSAMAVAYNIALAIFGGTAPLVATWLIKETGDLAAPAWYVAAIALVSAVATFTLKGRLDRAPAR